MKNAETKMNPKHGKNTALRCNNKIAENGYKWMLYP